MNPTLKLFFTVKDQDFERCVLKTEQPKVPQDSSNQSNHLFVQNQQNVSSVEYEGVPDYLPMIEPIIFSLNEAFDELQQIEE